MNEQIEQMNKPHLLVISFADFEICPKFHPFHPQAFIDEDGTSQLAVVDADGNALSMTHSLNNA
jgi:gamma-glutamyltranspeptidase